MTQTANPHALRPAGPTVSVEQFTALQAAYQQTRELNEKLAEKLRSIEEGMMMAGAVGIVREVLDDGRLVLTMGRSEIVVGVADPNLKFQVGDMVQTDVNRMLAVKNLGLASRFAPDTVEFVSWGENGTATVRQNGELRVYATAESLRNGGAAGIEPGALLLASHEMRFVFGLHSSAACEDYISELPALVYAGSREVLAKIERILFDPLFAEPRKRQPGRLVILSGPAGSGKSYSALALAQRRGVPVERLTTEDVSSSYVSVSSTNIKGKFERAIKQARKGEPVLILLEECDSLCRRRTGYTHRCAASDEMGKITSTILTQLDRLVQLGPDLPIAVVFTTNLVNELDPAIRSRAAAEIEVTYIDRDYGSELLKAHLAAGDVELEGGDRELDRLADILFDGATPIIQVEAEIGQTTERFRLTPAHTMLPRLVAGVAADVRELDSPVAWRDAASAAHARILAHARQIASSPEHYVPYADHPFAGDPDLRIRRAISVYPEVMPREFLTHLEGGETRGNAS